MDKVQLSTIFPGLMPALRAAPIDIQTVLRQGGRGAAGLARDPARSAYIAAETALALVLLISAGLLLRTAMAAQQVRPGFSPDRVMTGRTALPRSIRKFKSALSTFFHLRSHFREGQGNETVET